MGFLLNAMSKQLESFVLLPFTLYEIGRLCCTIGVEKTFEGIRDLPCQRVQNEVMEEFSHELLFLSADKDYVGIALAFKDLMVDGVSVMPPQSLILQEMRTLENRLEWSSFHVCPLSKKVTPYRN
jgi:hypothetical protein